MITTPPSSSSSSSSDYDDNDNHDEQNYYVYKGIEDVPKDVTHVMIHRSVSIIERYTFQKCFHLTSVIMKEEPKPKSPRRRRKRSSSNSAYAINPSVMTPSSVNTTSTLIGIDRCAFGHCTSLQSIKLPEGITYIRQNAFRDCTSLTTIELPNTLKEIGSTAFRCCKSIHLIDLPFSVIKIGFGAFYHCENLISVCIRSSSRSRSRSSLSNDDNDDITICTRNDNEVSSLFSSSSSLFSSSLPTTLKIYPAAFRGCKNLVNIALPPPRPLPSDYNHNNNNKYKYKYIEFMERSGEFHVRKYPYFSKCTLLQQIFEQSERMSKNKKNQNNNKKEEDDDNDGIYIHKWLQYRFDNLPLHELCYQYSSSSSSLSSSLSSSSFIPHHHFVTMEGIQKIIQTNTKHNTIEAIDSFGFTILHLLVCCGWKISSELLRFVVGLNPSMVFVKAFNGMTPLELFWNCIGIHPLTISSSTKSTSTTSSLSTKNRISLIDAIRRGLHWNIIERIFILDPQTLLELEKVNEMTDLVPFLEAASLPQCSLDVLYELTRLSVSVIVTFANDS